MSRWYYKDVLTPPLSAEDRRTVDTILAGPDARETTAGD